MSGEQKFAMLVEMTTVGNGMRGQTIDEMPFVAVGTREEIAKMATDALTQVVMLHSITFTHMGRSETAIMHASAINPQNQQ